MNEIAIIFSGERVAFHGFDEWSFPATAARMRIWAEGAAKAIADYQSEILHIHNEKVDACVRATAAEAELEAIKQGQLRDAGNVPDHRNDLVPGELHCAKWAPSTDWEQGGPIIEREMIGVCRSYVSGWDGYVSFHRTKNGPTLLIAAMRSYVATKYGDEVPDMEAA